MAPLSRLPQKNHRTRSILASKLLQAFSRRFVRRRAERPAAMPFMKKPSRRSHQGETARRSTRESRRDGAQEGRWSFNLASDILFALGSTESARRVAYRTPTGELRFLPR